MKNWIFVLFLLTGLAATASRAPAQEQVYNMCVDAVDTYVPQCFGVDPSFDLVSCTRLQGGGFEMLAENTGDSSMLRVRANPSTNGASKTCSIYGLAPNGFGCAGISGPEYIEVFTENRWFAAWKKTVADYCKSYLP